MPMIRPLRLCALAVALSFAAHAASFAADNDGPLTATGLEGMWIIKKGFDAHDPLPLTPFAQAAQEKARAELAAGHVIGAGQGRCDPVGMPGFMTNEFGLQILEMPGRVVMISEMSPLSRQIYLDQPQSDGDNGPLWNGHSVGHWEGKTLVIDTINFREPDNPIVFGGVRSANLHLIERYHLENDGKLLVGELTFIDPKLLTRPYVSHVAFTRLPNDAPLWEYACQTDDPAWSQRFQGDAVQK